jgi:hypothetical protein
LSTKHDVTAHADSTHHYESSTKKPTSPHAYANVGFIDSHYLLSPSSADLIPSNAVIHLSFSAPPLSIFVTPSCVLDHFVTTILITNPLIDLSTDYFELTIISLSLILYLPSSHPESTFPSTVLVLLAISQTILLLSTTQLLCPTTA